MEALGQAIPYVVFEKSRPMPAPSFPFIPLNLIFITHILHHSKTTLILEYFLSLTVTHHSSMWPAEVVLRLKMGQNTVSVRYIAGFKCLSAYKGRRTSHIIY